jgi:hypothetical protein
MAPAEMKTGFAIAGDGTMEMDYAQDSAVRQPSHPNAVRLENDDIQSTV